MEYKLFEYFLPKDAIEIRFKVFTLEQGFSKDADLDEKDEKSIHILVFQDKQAIATARMFKEGDRTYHIGRLTVLKEYRGKGIGSFVLQTLERKAKELGANRTILGSQIDKTKFYEKCGYVAFGDVFDDANYPHIMMGKNL